VRLIVPTSIIAKHKKTKKEPKSDKRIQGTLQIRRPKRKRKSINYKLATNENDLKNDKLIFIRFQVQTQLDGLSSQEY
jgi:hypothetical protein